MFKRALHLTLFCIIILQSLFLGLSISAENGSKPTLQEDFTLINLNKEHAHSEASGIILFSITGETETELTETAVNFLKQIKTYLSHSISLAASTFELSIKEIIKCGHFTYRPSLLHIALFLFNADLRI